MKNSKYLLAILTIITVIFSSASVFAANDNRWGWGGDRRDEQKVNFYIQISGQRMDKNGSIQGQDSKFFTDVVASSTLSKSLPNNYKIAIGGNVTESDITANLSSVPSEKNVLKNVVLAYESMDAYIRSSNGKVIPWSKMTTDYYRVQWYVLKKESDCWHVDGVIIDLETDKEISIVVPEEDAKRAACVELDVKTNTYTPGIMKVKANRPHSYWEGDNDNLVINGFGDVWYTVLDETTFEQNDYVIPSNLINAAKAVETLAGARLSELSEQLQKQYGRIDSQAYRQEYIERTGSGKSLYVTPYISDMLRKRYNVNTDEYIWLAMGDSQGNIVKVYVMDRDMAGAENLFENE